MVKEETITTTPETKQTNERREFIRFALIALLIVIPIRLFVAQPFIVEGASMDPTFASGEYLIVDEFSFYTREPMRGEVVVFKYPKDPKKYYIKRIIGLPGETISGVGDVVTITSSEHPDGMSIDESYVVNKSPSNFERTLGTEEYFVMGDNRPASSDSRFWGAVPRENIVGRAYLRLFPPSTISYLPGAITPK